MITPIFLTAARTGPAVFFHPSAARGIPVQNPSLSMRIALTFMLICGRIDKELALFTAYMQQNKS